MARTANKTIEKILRFILEIVFLLFSGRSLIWNWFLMSFLSYLYDFTNNDSSGSLLISNYFHLHSNYDDIIWAWSTCILCNSLCKLSCSRSRSSTRPGHVLSSLISLLLWEISNNKYETKMNSLGKYSFEKKSCEFSQVFFPIHSMSYQFMPKNVFDLFCWELMFGIRKAFKKR